MEKKLFVLLAILIAALVFNPGCKKSSEVTETPEPTVRNANVTVSSFTTVATRAESSGAIGNEKSTGTIVLIGVPTGASNAGYIYEVNLTLRETGGASAAITAVDFTFSADGTAFGTYSADVGDLFGTTSISANGTLSAALFLTSEPGYPYADLAEVNVSWNDSTGAACSVDASVQNPMLEDADIVLLEDTVALGRKRNKSYFLTGLVKNIGNYTAWNVMVTFTALGDNDVFLDTASGFPAALGDIPPDSTAAFEAIFFDITRWSLVKKIFWKTEWLTRSGSSVEKEGVVYVQ